MGPIFTLVSIVPGLLKGRGRGETHVTQMPVEESDSNCTVSFLNCLCLSAVASVTVIPLLMSAKTASECNPALEKSARSLQ